MTPEELITNDAWRLALKSEFEKPYFQALWEFVLASYKSSTVYPELAHIFRAFNYRSPKDVKVVLLGQDPYHGPQQADGLCFSVGGSAKIPPSLRNIYKALHQDIHVMPPASGGLSGWAKQGVLLLNTVLTVEDGKPGSHQRKGWEQFTDEVIRIVLRQASGCVFLCWGAAAEKKAGLVTGAKHLVLKSVHPSPLSAYRGFLTCRHFSRANAYLQSNGKTPIKWNEMA